MTAGDCSLCGMHMLDHVQEMGADGGGNWRCPTGVGFQPAGYFSPSLQAIKGVGPDAPTVVNEAGAKQSHLPYRCDLLPARAVLAVAEVLEQGARKYGADNWRGIPEADHVNHALAHLFARLAGDASDDHLEHAACRLLMALDKKRGGADGRRPGDRPGRRIHDPEPHAGRLASRAVAAGRGRETDPLREGLAVRGRKPTPPPVTDGAGGGYEPPMPPDLSDVAAAKWRVIVPQIARLVPLKDTDGDALRQYVEAAVMRVRAVRELDEADSLLACGPNGTEYPHPLFKIISQQEGVMLKLAERFGLDPASRRRLQIEAVKADTAFAEFLKRGKRAVPETAGEPEPGA